MLRIALAAIPLQLAFLAGHFALLKFAPQSKFPREALPVAYLAVTYAQWLVVAFLISWRANKYPVPLVMHLPHLMSFLPLIRHIILAANRTPSDDTSLTLAWLHSVATHCFSLCAAWLWQLRDRREGDLPREEKMRLILFASAALTAVIVYGGLDLAFAESGNPLEIALLQLSLNIAVTGILLFRRHKPFAIAAAVVFSLGNAALLFDNSRSDFGVEISLAATSLTQFFALYVFELQDSARANRHAETAADA